MYNFESDSSLIIYVSRRNHQTAGVLFGPSRGPVQRPWSSSPLAAVLRSRPDRFFGLRGSRPRSTCVSI